MISSMKLALVALLASTSLVAAAPGQPKSESSPGYAPPPQTYPAPKTSCTNDVKTIYSTGKTSIIVTETKTIPQVMTKTGVNSVTSVITIPYTTTVTVQKPYTTTIPLTKTATKTKVITTTYTELLTTSKVETGIHTGLSTAVGEKTMETVITKPYTTVLSTYSASVCPVTSYKPYTTSYVKTETKCATKTGGGW
ncbi:hypothetical protein IWZ00DRAFT_130512 [Phyllosticta capitalensis]